MSAEGMYVLVEPEVKRSFAEHGATAYIGRHLCRGQHTPVVLTSNVVQLGLKKSHGLHISSQRALTATANKIEIFS